MKQRFRQVHLDFHTSEFIPGVGKDFDAEEFARTLHEARVNSITCFARCHHGWLYYPSKLQPEMIHPHLENKNLLIEQIEACHRYDIKVPIYTTVQWDAAVARMHPEWLSVDDEGNYINTQGVPEPHFYYTICLNSGYREYFFNHLEDLIDSIGADRIDGLFLDILFPVDCACERCTAEMTKRGYNPAEKSERKAYSNAMLREFQMETSAFIRERAPHAGIFYNSSHVSPRLKPILDAYTHLEIESLPSGGWGYMHFPTTVRYARQLGKDLIGMTGKFHTYWGDFHSFKNKAALEYECFQMLAFGAGCSIGDQLDPRGTLSKGTYELIGHVYSQVEAKEPYCIGAKPVTEIGVLTPEEFYSDKGEGGGLPTALVGLVRMLQELAYQFDIIDSTHEFDNYKLLILPDRIQYSPELEKKLRGYLERGGKIIGSYHSGLDLDGRKESIFGVSYEKESDYYRDFIIPNDRIGKGLPQEEHVMYLRGAQVAAHDTEVLVYSVKPYFDRAGEKYCSHQHAPSSGEQGSPAVTKKGGAVYFSHPIFEIYYKNAARWCKIMMKDAIEMLMTDKLLSHSGPSTLITTINRQKEQKRDIVHILNYVTLRRSKDIEIIEDIIPLYNTEFRIFVGDKNVTGLRLVPSGKLIDYKMEGRYLAFKLDKIEGHEMVCINYDNI